MNRTWFLAATLILGLAAPALAAEIPIDQISLPVPRDKEVRLDFPVGELRVEASRDNRVSFDLTARCRGWNTDRCEDRAERIHVETNESGGVLRFSVKGYPKFNSGNLKLRGTLRVPAELALRIDMGVGALRITDVEGDLDVDLGVGDADIRLPNRAVRSVDVATGVGDANVIAQGSRVRHRSFVSCTASWDRGPGKSNVNLNVGVGDATVRVD